MPTREQRAKNLGISVDELPDGRGRHGNHVRGSRNGRWNGGRMRTSHGYIAVKVPDRHHLRQVHGYAYEHNLVAEETLGRRLRPDEIVHHKNGIRNDNRPENLAVETRSDHAREHAAVPGARDKLGRFAPEHLRVREFPKERPIDAL